MTRRKFLMQSGRLAAVAFASTWLPRRAFSNPLGKAVGIQLYTIREAMDADAPGTLKKLREIGYGAVETAGFGKRTAKEFRKLLDDNGLVCPSAHLGFGPDKIGASLDDANALGAKYATSGSLDALVNAETPKAWSATRAMSRDEAKRTAGLCNRLGEAAKKAGLLYAYHNHAFEFTDLGDGTTTYDLLLHETDPALVKFEIDCGWMVFAGHNPVDYFTKHPNRIPMIHVKDFLRNAPGAPKEMQGAELGRGVVDYKPIFAAGAKNGLQHYFVEQEGPFARMSPMDAAKVDYDYVHSLG